MANENKQMSLAGLADLRRHEGAVLRYYNDIAHNCTYGVGVLVHYGPCTSEESRRTVTVAQVDSQLSIRMREAEAAVRRQVTNTELTQEQFDALVSYTFNRGGSGARSVLEAANRIPLHTTHLALRRGLVSYCFYKNSYQTSKNLCVSAT